MKNQVVPFLLALAFGGSAAAAPPADTDATAPPPSTPRPLNLPRVAGLSLSNGLKVKIVEDRRIPLVTMRLSLPAGSVHDARGAEGTADAVASLLTAGVPEMTSANLASAVAALGGSINGDAGMDSAAVSGSVLSENFGRFFDIFSKVCLSPTFPEDELKIYQANALQKLALSRSRPGFLSSVRLNALLFGEHPYARVSASERSLGDLSVERLRTFYRRYYAPSGAILVIYGDVTRAKAEDLARRQFSDWRVEAPAPEAVPGPPARSGRTVAMVERPDSVQARIDFATIAPTARSPEYFPLQVANNILGGGTASHLFLDVREKRGYTYDPDSSYSVRHDFGTWEAGCDARNDVAIAAAEGFIENFDAMAKAAPSPAELEHAKSYLGGAFALRLATQAGVVNQLVTIERLGLPEDWLKGYRPKLAAVTAEEVEQASRRYLGSGDFVLVVVGEPKLKEGLSKFGKVVAYDADGRLLPAAR